MPDIIFGEPRVSSEERMGTYGASRMAAWLVKKRIAGSEKTANWILLGFAAIVIVISLFLFFSVSTNRKPRVIPLYKEDISEEARQKMPPGVFEALPSRFQQ